MAAIEAVLPAKNLPWRPWLVSTFDSEKKSKRLSGIQQHFKGRGAVNSVVLLLPGLWTARCTGVQSSVGAHLSHGLLNRWTDIFILPRPAWGLTFNLNNGTETHSIFVKL